jgi:hypothetical protein
MKHAAKFFVIAGSALLLTIVASSRSTVNTHVSALKTVPTSTISIWADGGAPIPPPPSGVGVSVTAVETALLADGGAPIPPPPSGIRVSVTAMETALLADGGAPIPPPPSGLSTVTWSSNSQII